MAVVDFCDQSIATDPPKKDRTVGTDPIMESRGVGTEQYDLVNSMQACQHDPVPQTSHGVSHLGRGYGMVQSCGCCAAKGGTVAMANGSNAAKGRKKAKIHIKSKGRKVAPSPSVVKVHEEMVHSDCQVTTCDRAPLPSVVRVHEEMVHSDCQVTTCDRENVQGGGETDGFNQKVGKEGTKVVVREVQQCNVVVRVMVEGAAKGGTAVGDGDSARLPVDSIGLGIHAPLPSGADLVGTRAGPSQGDTRQLAKASQTEAAVDKGSTEETDVGTGLGTGTCPPCGVEGRQSKLGGAKDATTAASHHTRPATAGLAVGQPVLARWPDKGWYCYAQVLQHEGEDWCVLEAEGDTETVHSSDIVIPNDTVSCIFKVREYFFLRVSVQMTHDPPLGTEYSISLPSKLRRQLCSR